MTDRETSNEERLQSDLKGGDRAEFAGEFVSSESLDQMSQRAVGWQVLVHVAVRFGATTFRRWADSVQGGTDGGMRVLESLPDAVGRGIAHVAAGALEGFAFVPGRGSLFEELPELCGRKEEPFDFIGDPDAEGTSTALSSSTVATKNAVCPDRFSANVLPLETFEDSMSVAAFPLSCSADRV